MPVEPNCHLLPYDIIVWPCVRGAPCDGDGAFGDRRIHNNNVPIYLNVIFSAYVVTSHSRP